MDNRALDLERRIRDSLQSNNGIAYHEPTRNRQHRSNGKRCRRTQRFARITIRRWEETA